jgi:hypothetical protein
MHADYKQLLKEIATNKWKANDPEIWKHVSENYPADSDIQLKRLDPAILAALLRTQELNKIQQKYKYFDGLASLRRSPSSRLPLGRDSNGNMTEMKLDCIMPEKDVRTVVVKHHRGSNAWFDPKDETAEYLIWHRMAAT